jgi:hypothetical protein
MLADDAPAMDAPAMLAANMSNAAPAFRPQLTLGAQPSAAVLLLEITSRAEGSPTPEPPPVPPTPPIVTSGLVMELDSGNAASYPGTGTAWTDLSGNGNNATLTNGPTYSAANGGQIVFDGVNDWVSGSAIDIASSGTVEVWFYRTGSGSPDGAGVVDLVSNVNSSGNAGWGCALKNNNKLNFYIANNGGFGVEDLSSASLSINTWYQAVFTYNGSNKIIYLNGAQDSSFSSAVNGTSTQIWGIAARNTGARNFQGSIPIARIYNRALSASEITQNFDANKARFGL